MGEAAGASASSATTTDSPGPSVVGIVEVPASSTRVYPSTVVRVTSTPVRDAP
jgi:hypothetical protein